jgi:hypothetical protein
MAAAKEKKKSPKANGARASGGKSQPRKKSADAGPAGLGHNLTKIKQTLKKYALEHDRLLGEKEEFDGKMMMAVRGVYEDASNDLGVPRKIVRIGLTDLRREKKRKQMLSELETEDRESLETIEDALHDLFDTPLGQAAARRELAQTEDQGSFEP